MKTAVETAALVGLIAPDAAAAGAYSSGWIKADAFNRYMAIASVGVMATGSTVDAKLEQATSSGGAGVKNVTGKVGAQLTEAGGDSNKQQVFDLIPADHLDIANGFSYFRLTITVGTAASDCDGKVIGVDPVNGPAKDHDAASVAAIY